MIDSIVGVLVVLLTAVAGLTWQNYLLLKRVERLELRPVFPKEFAISVITADLVSRLMDDLDEDDEEEEPTGRTVN